VKLQRSSYRPSAAAAGQSPITNAVIDELWQRERSTLMQAAGAEIATLLDLGDAFARSRPVLFCKKSRRYFHPFCPACHALLEDCRDDALLRDLGLPQYSGTTVRYLYCKTCKPGTFYTYSLTPEELPKGSIRIRRRAELYQDMLASKGAPANLFPCASCGHDADGISRAIVPVSYYEFHMLPLETLPLHFDELSDLLGGADWAELKRTTTEVSGAAGRERLLAALDAGYSSPVQWFFRGDAGGRFPLEVLRLKLAAFTQVCRGVRHYHAKARMPHLDLNPSSVMVSVPPPSQDLPARWNFQIKLLDLASPQRFRAPGGTDVAAELLLPAPDVPKTYLSPIARSGGTGADESERITIKEIKFDGAVARFEIETVSSKARLREYRPRDVARIVPATQLSWLENASLWGTVSGVGDRGFRISATLVSAHKGLAALKLPITLEAGVALHKRFHVPVDLYALGMLLLRSILVHDGQDIFAVEDLVQRVLQKLMVALEGGGGGADFKRVASQLQWQLEAQQDAFNRNSVLFVKADRLQKGNAIPPRLWQDLLVFAFRLITNIDGFSFCQHHGDYPPDSPESVMDEVLTELGSLNARLHIELFAAADRDRTIFQACDEVMSELLGGGAGGGTMKGGLEAAEFSS
jgi:hypothetical protein